MDMDKSEKKKGDENKQKASYESVLNQRVFKLTVNGDAGGLEKLHEKGSWTDVGLVVDSGKGDDGNMWHWSALAMAASYNHLEVVRVLIKMGCR